MKPIVKWAGGKTRLLKYISPIIPDDVKTYIEPFFGGGAVFINTEFKNGIINDLNSELMSMYEAVRDEKDNLINELEKYKKNDNEEFFYKLRSLERTSKLNELPKYKRAARFIYLNKTCFGGLYRVNSLGHFNVPYAKNINGKEILNKDNITEWSNKLNNKNVKMLSKDFEEIIDNAKKGDFIFVDPPYFDWSKTANFTSYTKEGFSIKDQERLRSSLKRANNRGVLFILTNTGNEKVKNFYKDFHMKKVPISRTIAASKNKSGYFEYIITNIKKI